MPTKTTSKAKRKERIERIMLFLITKTKIKFYNHEQKYNHRRAMQSINPVSR